MPTYLKRLSFVSNKLLNCVLSLQQFFVKYLFGAKKYIKKGFNSEWPQLPVVSVHPRFCVEIKIKGRFTGKRWFDSDVSGRDPTHPRELIRMSFIAF